VAQNLGCFCNFPKKVTKVNNLPTGEASPNLATLNETNNIEETFSEPSRAV
jgi:hypothetical protein